MKTDKVVKVVAVVLTVLMLLMIATNVFAITPGEVKATSTSADTQITNYGGKILSAVTTAGIVLSVIVLAVLGIKYMLGSAEEKAEYKKTLMPYIVGAALIFGASAIANIVYTFFLTSASTT